MDSSFPVGGNYLFEKKRINLFLLFSILKQTSFEDLFKYVAQLILYKQKSIMLSDFATYTTFQIFIYLLCNPVLSNRVLTLCF